jgi:hypothetical protein
MKPAGHSVPCACGHDHAAHQHYRYGSECALCECPRWRPNRGLRRFAVLVLDRLSKLPVSSRLRAQYTRSPHNRRADQKPIRGTSV